MELPEGKSLYDILELDREQVEKDTTLIKKAYRKLALQYHPDKQSTSTSTSSKPVIDTTEQFQLVGHAYSILNDPIKRQHYDMGEVFLLSDNTTPGGKTWTDYFMDLFNGVVNADTLEKHASEYKDSAEEQQDVLKHYTEHKGNMNRILAYVPHSSASDVPRFMDMINTALKANNVKTYSAYARTTTKSAQLRRIKREEKEAKEMERQDEASKSVKGKQRQEPDTQRDGDTIDILVETIETRQEQSLEEQQVTLTAMVEEKQQQYSTDRHDDKAVSTSIDVNTKKTRTKSKKPPASTSTTVSSSHRHDTADKKAQPTRTIATRSMTRNQQTEANRTRGSKSTSTKKSQYTLKDSNAHKRKHTKDEEKIPEEALRQRRRLRPRKSASNIN
ncbi:hypothetical protein BC941DRAFT_434814 [Chlamydoabsidia padenii]|nr:hypothetical protein BC941DRAFT_434814 [Chlamydoabsidia padenii]